MSLALRSPLPFRFDSGAAVPGIVRAAVQVQVQVLTCCKPVTRAVRVCKPVTVRRSPLRAAPVDGTSVNRRDSLPQVRDFFLLLVLEN